MTAVDDFVKGIRPRINKLVNGVEMLAPLKSTLTDDDKALLKILQSCTATLLMILDEVPIFIPPLLSDPGIFSSTRLEFIRVGTSIPAVIDLIIEDYQQKLTTEQEFILADLRKGYEELSEWMAEFAAKYAARFD